MSCFFNLFTKTSFIKTSANASQNLVSGIEQFGRLLGKTLSSDATAAIKTRPNIGTYLNTTGDFKYN